MAFRKTKMNNTYYVNYSSNDGRSYGVMAVCYCKSETQALAKAKDELKRTNPKADEYRFAVA